MSVVFGQKDSAAIGMHNKFALPPMTFMDNVRGTFGGAYNNPARNIGKYAKDQWDDMLSQLEGATGQAFSNPASAISPSVLQMWSGEAPEPGAQARIAYQYSVNEIRNYVRENRDNIPEELAVAILSEDAMTPWQGAWREEADSIFRADQQEMQALAMRDPSATGAIGRFVGAMANEIRDPVSVTQVFAPVGPGRLASIMFREALVNMTLEVGEQKQVKEWYDSLGLEYSQEEFLRAVAASGALGASAPLVIRIGNDVVRLTAEQARRGYEALRAAGVAETETSRAILRKLEAEEELFAKNPYADTPAGRAAFERQIRRVTEQVEAGRPVEVDEIPADLRRVAETPEEAVEFERAVRADFEAAQRGDIPADIRTSVETDRPSLPVVSDIAAFRAAEVAKVTATLVEGIGRTEAVPLDRIEVMRPWVDIEKVGKIAAELKEGVEPPPVQIARVDGQPVLIRGDETVEAAIRRGDTEIAAEVVDVPKRQVEEPRVAEPDADVEAPATARTAGEPAGAEAVPATRGELPETFQEDLNGFDSPDGAATQRQVEFLQADLRGQIESGEIDIDQEFPITREVDGEMVEDVVTIREMLEEIEEADDIVATLEVCALP